MLCLLCRAKIFDNNFGEPGRVPCFRRPSECGLVSRETELPDASMLGRLGDRPGALNSREPVEPIRFLPKLILGWSSIFTGPGPWVLEIFIRTSRSVSLPPPSPFNTVKVPKRCNSPNPSTFKAFQSSTRLARSVTAAAKCSLSIAWFAESRTDSMAPIAWLIVPESASSAVCFRSSCPQSQ